MFSELQSPTAVGAARVSHVALADGQAPDRVVIADAELLLGGHFKKSGPDLIITGKDGQKVVISGYFSSGKLPDLVTAEGAGLPGHLVERLAVPNAPGQYAQVGAPAGGVVIGKVERLGGSATVQHANGVVEELKIGDNVLQGDVVETRDGSLLAISFSDGTAFNMGANARMVLNELIYEAGGSSNSAVFSLVKGTITFVAGQVAKTGNMRVDTPVATMGIRGTTVNTTIESDVNGNIVSVNFSLMADPDGKVGSFNIIDRATGVIIGTVNTTSTSFTVTPSANLGVLAQQINKTPEQVAMELAIAQNLFPVFLANPANFQSQNPQDQQPKSPSTPGSSSSPPGGSTPGLPDTSPPNQVPGNGGPGQNGGTPGGTGGGDPGNGPIVHLPGNLSPAVFADAPPDLNEAVTEGDPGASQSTAQIVKVDPDGEVSYNVVALVGAGWIALGGGVFRKDGAYGSAYLNTGTNSLTYVVDNEKADPLRASDHPVETFIIPVIDDQGATASTTATFTVNGQNDPPQIVTSSTDAHGDITEADWYPVLTEGGGEGEGNPSIELTDSGTITFKDPELTDTHTAEQTFVSAVWTKHGGGTENIAEDPGALTLGTVQENPADANNQGSVGWAYSISSEDADFLAEGETLLVTYNVTITDSDGALVVQQVTVTITGTNDEPVIAVACGDSDAADLTEGDVGLSAGGTLSVSDVDVTNSVAASVEDVCVDGDLPQGLTVEMLKAMLSVDCGDVIGSSDTAGTIHWSFDSGQEAFDFLACGETLTLTYTVRATDSDGGYTDRAVTVTITGTNDAPAIEASQPAGLVEAGESGAGNGVATVQLTTVDPDRGDSPTYYLTHYVYVAAPGLSWAQAQAAAVGMGGYLANITSAAENTYVFTNVTQGAGAWIGGSDAAQEGVWTWANGPESGQTFWTVGGSNGGYANWWGTEPNDSGAGGEDFVFMDHNGVWTDVPSTYYAVNGYVVEFNGYTQQGKYGLLVLDPETGTLTYTLDNNDPDTQALSAGETATEQFLVSVFDSHGASATTPVTFTITGSNDAPAIQWDSTPIATPGVAVINGISIEDDPAPSEVLTVHLSSSYGVITLSQPPANSSITILPDDDSNAHTLSFTGTLADINAFLAANSAQGAPGIVYTADQGYTGPDQLVFTIEDAHGATDTQQLSIAVGAPETISPLLAFSGIEDQQAPIALTLTGQDFDGQVTSFRLTSLPQHGMLFLDAGLTQAVALNDLVAAGSTQVPNEFTATVYFKPDADWNGSTSLQYAAIDNNQFEDPSPATVEIDVASVNDAPHAASNTVTIDEDGVYAFSESDFAFGDADGNDFDALVIETLPSAGVLSLNGQAVTQYQVISADDIGQLVFTPASDGNGAGYASFIFKVQDDGGLANGGANLSGPYTFTINVTPVDDAPQVNVNPTYMDFDGSDAVVGSVATRNVGNASADGVTLEGWVNWDGAGPSQSSHQLLFYNGSTSDSGFGLFGVFDNGTFTLEIFRGGIGGIDTDIELNAGWHHLAVTHVDGTFQLFVDGQPVFSTAGLANAIPDPANFPQYMPHTLIGGTDTGTEAFVGSIAEVRVWEVARTGQEIASDRAVSLLGEEPGLVGYWPLDEGDGPGAKDHAGTPQNLTTVGDPAWVVDGIESWPGDAAIRVVEDSPTKLHGLSVSDVDGGSAEITLTLSIPNGSGSLSAVAGGNVVVGGGPGALTLTGSIADINAFLADPGLGVTYAPALNSVADVVLSIAALDQDVPGGPHGTTETVLLDLQPVNDAPTLDDAALPSASENSNGVSQRISDMFASKFHDVDAGAFLAGIAVVGGAVSNAGVWKYSYDNDVWHEFDANLQLSQAQLLPASAWLTFVPAPGFSGPVPALDVYAIDNSINDGAIATQWPPSVVDLDPESYPSPMESPLGGWHPFAQDVTHVTTSVTEGANSAPVIDMTYAVSVDLNETSAILLGPMIWDADAGNSTLRATFTSSAGGALDLFLPQEQGGLTDLDQNPGVLVLEGSWIQLSNAVMTGIKYTEPGSLPAADAVIFTVDDLNGGTDTYNIQFAVADPPPGEGISLSGTAGPNDKDMMFGTDNADVLNGGTGDDILVGHLGNDTLTGGTGADMFVFTPELNAGNTIITDFNVSEGDMIVLDDFAQEALNALLSDLVQGSDTIELAPGHTITLQGVDVSTLHASDFFLRQYGV